MQPVEKDGPGGLEHLDEDVVVDVGDEVRHLVMREVEPVEFGLQVGAEPAELLLVRHGDAPGKRQRVLNLFELEHEGENFVVVVHHFLRENGRQGGQV